MRCCKERPLRQIGERWVHRTQCFTVQLDPVPEEAAVHTSAVEEPTKAEKDRVKMDESQQM